MTETAVMRVRNGAKKLRSEYSISELAEIFNKSPRTITRWTAKPREEYLSEQQAKRAQVIELHKSGKKPKDIASTTGYALSTVYAILKKTV
ncbi:helix-turn-helix domain-containing protein [Arcanobacterium canis]